MTINRKALINKIACARKLCEVVHKRPSNSNAMKHGLSYPIHRSLTDQEVIKELTAALAKPDDGVDQRQAALELAEAEWDVLRLHYIKVTLIEAENTSKEDAIIMLSPRLTALARYEGRIWARHRRALSHYTIARGE